MPDNLTKRRYLLRYDPTLNQGAPGQDGKDGSIDDFLPLNSSVLVHDGTYNNGQTLQAILDILLATDLVIGNINVAEGTAFELGTQISALTLSWTNNKVVLSQVLSAPNLDPITLLPADTNANVTFTPANTGDFTITLTVTDEVGPENQTVDIEVWSKIYYGVSTMPPSINNAFVLSLPSNSLQPDRLLDTVFTANAGEYFFIALPSNYGTPIFTAGGLQADMTLGATIASFTNASGGIEEYKVWYTTYDNLGTMDFKVE